MEADGRDDAKPEEIPWICEDCHRSRTQTERYVIRGGALDVHVCGRCWSDHQEDKVPQKEKTMPTPEWLEHERLSHLADGDFERAHRVASEQHEAFREKIQTLEGRISDLEAQLDSINDDLDAENERLESAATETLAKVRAALDGKP